MESVKVTPSYLIKQTSKELRKNSKLLLMIRTGIQTSSDDNGWSQLGPVGSYLTKTSPDFDPRNYGSQKFSELVEAIGLFDIKRVGTTVIVRDARKVLVKN